MIADYTPTRIHLLVVGKTVVGLCFCGYAAAEGEIRFFLSYLPMLPLLAMVVAQACLIAIWAVLGTCKTYLVSNVSAEFSPDNVYACLVHPTMTTSETIRFYSVSDEYGCFSNFTAYPIRLKGRVWPTSEHFFQAQKFTDPAEQEEIRQAKSPMLAARMGRSRKRKLRREWESMKVNVMREAVLAKFTQHEELRDILLSTGDAKIVEHTANDSYWGDGGDGSGKNMLGRILMEVRETLRKQEQ